MIIITELIVLVLSLLFTGKRVKNVILINWESILMGILFGVVYVIIIFAVKQTELGSVVLEKFVKGIGLQFAILYTIYPFVIAVSEEFIFRYFIPSHSGVLIASLLFAALHWRPNFFSIPLFVLVFIFGLSQAWLFKKTRTIWAPVIAHLFVTYFLLLS